MRGPKNEPGNKGQRPTAPTRSERPQSSLCGDYRDKVLVFPDKPEPKNSSYK